MARAQAFAKMDKKPKFAVRYKNRCRSCGRSRSVYIQLQN
jgi:small subunit ribosomal protein S14